MPAVSVIVLVYKVEEYIERCARGLFGQTLEDIEYVFVDDCTPDASMEILERVLEDYPARRSQVRILRNDVNRGQAYSRCRGVEAATGDYIIHCDSDDWPETDMYARMYAKAREESLDVVICRMRAVSPSGRLEYDMDELGAEDLVRALIRQDICNYLTNKMFARKAYGKGIVFPRSNVGEDYATCIQLACNSGSFGYIYEILYNYVVRDGSITTSEKTPSKIDQLKENYDLAFSCLEAKGLADKYRDDIAYTKCWLKTFIQDFPRDYYVNLYPEVNFALLFNGHFTIMQRLGHLTQLLGIHGISKAFRKKR